MIQHATYGIVHVHLSVRQHLKFQVLSARHCGMESVIIVFKQKGRQGSNIDQC